MSPAAEHPDGDGARAPEHPDGPLPRLLVAYDGTSTSPFDLSAAAQGVCELAWLVDRDDPTLTDLARLLPRYGPVVHRGGRPLADVVAEVGALDVAGVVAFSDDQLGPAAEVARALGLEANPSETVAALTDKGAQRARLATGGLAGPAVARLDAGSTPAEAVAAARWDDVPCVVKPAQGTGSRDTWRAEGADQLLAGLCDHAGPDGRLPEDLVVEEWLAGDAHLAETGLGDYVSVEAMVVRGTCTPLAVTGKFPLAPPCRETGNFLPHHLAAEAAAAVCALAVQAVATLGVVTGAVHVEVKLTPDGPRIIEVNGRVPGGAIDQLFALRHGTTLTRLAVAAAVGRPLTVAPVDPTEGGGPFHLAWFLQAPPEARRLVGIGGIDRLAGDPAVRSTAFNRSVGDRLDWRAGSQGYIVSVVAVAEDVAALREMPGRLAALVAPEYADI